MDEKWQILIIEDRQFDGTSVCLAFDDYGINRKQLKVVETKEAIDTLKNNSYDFVFLNNCASNVETISLLKKLRSLKNRVPILVIVANSDEQINKELIEAGATDYIYKSSFSKEVLDIVLRNAIRLYSIEAKLTELNRQVQEKNEIIVNQKQEIEIQNQNLMEVFRLKSQFLATISHELRTPMNAIIGFSQLLLRPKCGTISKQQKDMLERILNNGKNLLMLVNEVLDYSKLQAGKLELKLEVFDLERLVKVTVAEMQSLAEAKRLHLKVDINLQNPTLYNDSLRVRQILNKLLSNAIKFTKNGSIGVEVREKSCNTIELAVKDTGIGIAAEDIQHIFEPFRQLDQGTNRKFEGTGNGLSIVQALVNMMKGKITVESELGKGTLFRIELPRQV
ncbi:response regulator receiver signal transduction histidine kinase [Calothrix parasitica NIES-267]|uniref:Circadian input-output histidine kinase CikA n=1 Tax=Calothrix parasitica NIES-267 TaxID=1973488 RepID=A0A1Z4LZZ3_9CYAN|nr:response regulator receiver signal transduction histidine kinase [Calothrix parasitica NIES-267]